jgi:ABC-type multidrug transport system, permease component
VKFYWGFIRKEIKQTLRDPRMRLLLFIAPLIQLTIFGYALSTEANNIRLSVVGKPSDDILQTIHRRAIQSGWFLPANIKSTDPFDQVQKGEADAALVAPPEGLRWALERGGKIQLLINATNVTRAQSIERYMQAILLEVLPKYQFPQVQFDLRVLFNPAMRTSLFLIPGVMSMLICLITVLLTSMSITKEKEQGTFESLISAPVKPGQIIIGKTLPFVLLGMSNVPLILMVAIFVFDVPLRGSLFLFLLGAFVFVCCTVSLGLLISGISKNQQQAMMGGFLFLFPAMLLSGLVFPVENMPWAMRIFAYLNPLTYFIELLRNIMLKGGDLRLVFANICVLAGMCAVIMYISWKRFKTTL